MQSLRLFLSAAFSSPVFGPLNSSCRGLFILSATSLQFRKTAGFCLFPLVSLVCFLFVRDYCSLFSNICCCCCKVASVVSNSVQPHRRQPTRLPRTWDSPGKNTGVGCHFLLQAKELGMAKNKVKYYLINLCFQNEIIFSRSLFGSYKLVPKKITSIS